MCYTAAAGWLAQLFFDYWLYTGDNDFLAKRTVPLLKEIALFYEDFLFEGNDGKLMFSPSLSPENTPEATIRKMQIVKRAALAPKDPSGQDRSVAAQATQAEAQARIELQKERNGENEEKDDPLSIREDTTDTAAANRLGRQASSAYQQTAFATNQSAPFPSNSSFSASA